MQSPCDTITSRDCGSELRIGMMGVPSGQQCGGVVSVAGTIGMEDSNTWAHVYMHHAMCSL